MPSKLPEFVTLPNFVKSFIEKKRLRTTFSWADVYQDEHNVAFSVAGMMERDMLKTTRDLVSDALKNGTPFSTFKRDLRQSFAKKGWGNSFESIDGATGEIKTITLSDYRLRRIYETNITQAYNAGSWAEIEASKKILPFLQYRLGPSVNHRDTHVKYNYLVLSVDDPFWDTHTPMNGWGCKCWVKQLTKSQALAIGVSKSPKINYVDWENKRTGVIVKVPEGVSPGFAYNVGKARQIVLDAQLRDKAIATNSFDKVADVFINPIKMSQYQNFIGKARNQTEIIAGQTKAVPRKEAIGVGYISPMLEQKLADIKVKTGNGVLVMTDNMITGTKIVEKHAKLGNALTNTDLNNLPILLNTPESIWVDVKDKMLIYFVRGEGERIKVVFKDGIIRTVFYVTDDGYTSFVHNPKNLKLQ